MATTRVSGPRALACPSTETQRAGWLTDWRFNVLNRKRAADAMTDDGVRTQRYPELVGKEFDQICLVT